MKKVVVGMSGGVDSSATAYLLKQEGYEVIGVTFCMFQSPDKNENGDGETLTPTQISVRDAKNVCDFLGIPHHIYEHQPAFQEKVIDYFCDTYLEGNTPNPCVRCNREIKFQSLLEAADFFGADFIATGHYARVVRGKDGVARLSMAANRKKDQSYALHRISQEMLDKLILPLGNFESKDEVRAIARKIGLSVADKDDSQDICFIPDGDYVGFLQKERGLKDMEGTFVDEDGNVIGHHKGYYHYTIGQRRGLMQGFGKRVYVIGISAEKNQVMLGGVDGLLTSEICGRDAQLLLETATVGSKIVCTAKMRYAQVPVPGTLSILEGNRIVFQAEVPQKKSAVGQFIVFYEGERVLGGAEITACSGRRGD